MLAFFRCLQNSIELTESDFGELDMTTLLLYHAIERGILHTKHSRSSPPYHAQLV